MEIRIGFGWLLAGGALLAALLLALWTPAPGQASTGQERVAPEALASTVERVPSMTAPKAKFFISRILKQNYKRVWVFGSKKSIYDCNRLSRVRVSCNVSWFYKKFWLHGHAAAYYRANGSVFVKYNIKSDKVD